MDILNLYLVVFIASLAGGFIIGLILHLILKMFYPHKRLNIEHAVIIGLAAILVIKLLSTLTVALLVGGGISTGCLLFNLFNKKD